MKSPFTGGNVTFQQEETTLTFRKEEFTYTHLSYRCEDTGEQFTTTELDEINIGQVYNQYRVKYGIPFPDEIKQIRQKYGLSASKMSEILGFGNNQYRLYENGDMPSEGNGKILSSIKDANFFYTFVQNTRNQFTAEEINKIERKIQAIPTNKDREEKERLIFNYSRSVYNGYAAQSYSKLKNILLYFIEKLHGVFNTKMNKLLFYTDFLSYKRYGRGITGLQYHAIQFGPVPERWDRIYALMDDIEPEIVHFANPDICGTKLQSTLSPDTSCFSPEEQSILDQVLENFRNDNVSSISNKSHQEDAWIQNNQNKGLINYNTAFTLHAFD